MNPCTSPVAPEQSPIGTSMGEVGLLATGAWRIVHSIEMLMAEGLSQQRAGGLVGAITIEFDGSS